MCCIIRNNTTMRIINVLNLNTIYSIPRKRNVPINHLLIHVSSRKENACCPSIVFASNNVTETDSETLHRLVHICSLHFWLAQRVFKPGLPKHRPHDSTTAHDCTAFTTARRRHVPVAVRRRPHAGTL